MLLGSLRIFGRGVFARPYYNRIDLVPYLVDRLAVGLGNKHCRDRFAD